MTLSDFLGHAGTQLLLAVTSLAAGVLVGLPLGTLAAHARRTRGAILAAANIGRAVPSLAVLTFVLPALGVGFVPSLVALSLLAIPPILINVDVGFRGVPFATVDAARGMGMSASQRLLRVEWPLARPVFFTGLRTAAIEVVASATLATFIGGGGLGDYIVQGISANQQNYLLAGTLGVAALAMLFEIALGVPERRYRRGEGDSL